LQEEGLEQHCADIEKCWFDLKEQTEASNAQALKGESILNVTTPIK
jgi:hypothetical protein